MDHKFKLIDYARVTASRNHLQDIAKILGAYQKLFIELDPNYWYTALEMTDSGFKTQDSSISFDVNTGQITLGAKTWALPDTSANQLFDDLQTMLGEQGAEKKMKLPELSEATLYDQESAHEVINLLIWSSQILGKIKALIRIGKTSPLLLYPHHFDTSLTWFKDDSQQYTLGFSTGDETIPEPYFYTTSYPQFAAFTDRVLPVPAYWQSDGFVGAVLKYNDLVHDDNPSNRAIEYFRVALSL